MFVGPDVNHRVTHNTLTTPAPASYIPVSGPAGTHVDVCCEQQHLSDHPAGATALAAALQSGMSLGPLMVLCETSYTPISQKDASGKGKQAGKKHCLLVSTSWCRGRT